MEASQELGTVSLAVPPGPGQLGLVRYGQDRLVLGEDGRDAIGEIVLLRLDQVTDHLFHTPRVDRRMPAHQAVGQTPDLGLGYRRRGRQRSCHLRDAPARHDQRLSSATRTPSPIITTELSRSRILLTRVPSPPPPIRLTT
jgi:hypothetical protein